MENIKIKVASDNIIVFFSSQLKVRFPKIFSEIERILAEKGINYKLLTGTNDIWCRDYLPVPDGIGGYVQFKFDPGYLKYKKYLHLHIDPYPLHQQLNVKPVSSELVLDGGNVIRYGRTLVLTDIVKKDNPDWSEETIRKELESKLNMYKVVIIPHQPYDYTGHADGMVRLLDEKRILVNDFSREGASFRRKLNRALRGAGLAQIPFPYSLNYKSTDSGSAVGTYINFLKIGRTIFLPAFKLNSDSLAESISKESFPNHDIFRIDCRSLAKEGGVLNCVGWVAKS